MRLSTASLLFGSLFSILKTRPPLDLLLCSLEKYRSASVSLPPPSSIQQLHLLLGLLNYVDLIYCFADPIAHLGNTVLI
ncbi:hypothetical protein AALP_AA4G164800 [Arabis alpina]|uniref:Uncharacterized protein n=1 Tax=Arabis alpina TaxID=50452 RepID=A0A087H3P5_ARAAL|nr:hypothetical protein AALP_AA4G164800 [Arabis alpina]